MYKSRNKIVVKFVEKLLKYRKIFKDILTFLGLDYKVASLIILCFVGAQKSVYQISDQSDN